MFFSAMTERSSHPGPGCNPGRDIFLTRIPLLQTKLRGRRGGRLPPSRSGEKNHEIEN